MQRFPELTEEQIMVIAGISREEIRHTRAVRRGAKKEKPPSPSAFSPAAAAP